MRPPLASFVHLASSASLIYSCQLPRLASFDNNTVADHGHTVILYQDAGPVWAAKYPPRVASAVFHQFLKVGRVVVQVREKLEID